MRILLAEDEQALRKPLVTVLEHRGYHVDAADNGAVAVDYASRGSYDCMIFDIMMPVMDGLEALKSIRKSGDLTPVIMLTAKSEIEDRIVGLDIGADDYLTKPFAMGELLARLNSLTRRQKDYMPSGRTYKNIQGRTEQGNVQDILRSRFTRTRRVRFPLRCAYIPRKRYVSRFFRHHSEIQLKKGQG